MTRYFLPLAALFGFLAVALGAFGAHALKARLDEYHLAVFRTGVDYQFYHAFALAMVGGLCLRWNDALLRGSGIAFVVGILIFSGSLYCLSLTGVRMWGAVTPIGGVAFLVGWVLLGWGCFRNI